jgi:DMSO/TMAO reductase YedYZ molybdopterin-dependent catalytic subunit
MHSTPGRREFLTGLTASATLLLSKGDVWAADEDKVIPFVGTQPFNPQRPGMVWDQLTSWVTPTEQLFAVSHYGVPQTAPSQWRIEIGGAVSKPHSISLDELKSRPKVEHTITLECSGNGPAGSLIGNAKWAGTPLAPILKASGIKPEGIEVVFFGVDTGTEKIRDADYKQNFARSLTLADALKSNLLLCYELNGQPLSTSHGGPVRLVVPGWYGVAWVKWINRIELHDRSYLSRFMARDYVTIRGEKRGDDTIWRETSVGRMNLKSVAARVTRSASGDARITGAAWSDGTPIRSVEVRIDDEPWKQARLIPNRDPFAWTFWTFDWSGPKPGEHTIASRAIDTRGKVQPAPDDPFITLKKSRWENNQQALRKIQMS